MIGPGGAGRDDTTGDAALRRRVAVAYGADLLHVPIGWSEATCDESLISLADRLAIALEHAPPADPAGDLPGDSHDDGDDSARAAPPPLPRLAAPGPTPEPAAAVDRLLRWAGDAGALLDTLDVRVADDGSRSVYARRALADGDPVTFVPASLLVTEAMAQAAFGAYVTRPLDHGHSLLAAWLAMERRKPDSWWRPWFDAIPVAPDLPWFRPDTDLADLAGTSIPDTVADARRSIVDDHARLVLSVPALGDLGLDELAWGRAIASSRVFSLTVAGHRIRALAPIADLIDHAPGGVRFGFDDERAGMTVTSRTVVEAGDELRLDYGAKSNRRLVVGYGFALPDNGEDEARLWFPPADDRRADLAAHLLWDTPLGRPMHLPITTRWDEHATRALSLARLRAATPREVAAITDRHRIRKRAILWLSAADEVAALESIGEAARAALAALPDPSGSPAGDDAWGHTCELARTGERRVLTAVVEFAAAAADLAADPSPWSYRAAAGRLTGDAGAERLLREYLESVFPELPR